MEATNEPNPINTVSTVPADLPMDVQEPQPSTSAAVVENKDKDIATEAEWQKPISLKALKKKLNELFVVK